MRGQASEGTLRKWFFGVFRRLDNSERGDWFHKEKAPSGDGFM